MTIQPAFTIENHRLYVGDSSKIVPSLDANWDVLLTDPPYGVQGGRGGNRQRRKAMYESDFSDTREYVGDVVVPVISYILKHVKRAAIKPGTANMDLYPKPVDIGCFWTPAAVGAGPWGFTTFHPILYYGKDPRGGRGSWPSGIQVTERAPTKLHPCAVPLSPWRWLLRKVSLPGETVIDPFMGAGTTGTACVGEGRTFVGVELDTKYANLARVMISEELSQKLLLIDEAVPEPVQLRVGY